MLPVAVTRLFAKIRIPRSPLALHSYSLCFSTMRAIQVEKFGGPEECKLAETAPNPPALFPKQVLVKLSYAGLNPVDTYIRSGAYAFKPSLPYVPCSDGAGEIMQVGNNVNKFKVGDRVFVARNLTGTCAEMCVSDEEMTFRLHPSLTYAQGACLGVPYGTALRALLTRARVRAGQTILVHGASGGVGLAATQIARAYGLTVFGTAGTAEGLGLVRANGAHEVFNHRNKDYIDGIRTATGGAGVDVIVEMLSNVNLQTDLDLLARNGTVVIVGSRGPIEINPRSTMAKESSIIGVKLGDATEKDWNEYRAIMSAGMEAGWLKPVIAQEYKLSQTGKAHKDIMESTGAKGNVVIKCK